MNYCTFDGYAILTAARSATGYTRFQAAEREIDMAKKKKAKRFRAVTAVKELARERVGAPPAGQIVVEKKKKPEKHKPTLGKLLEESE
jgi:hypothetical protein